MHEVFIRVDANHKVGFGHLKRCLIIANFLRKKKCKVSFLIKGSKVAKQIINSQKFNFICIPELKNLKQQANDFMNIITNRKSVIVTDIAHPLSFQDVEELKFYFKTIKNNNKHVTFDGSGKESLREILTEVDCDILVAPYIGETASKKKIIYEELLGTKYYILDKEYLLKNKRKIRKNAKNILVTCGGSDPTFVTEHILQALHLCIEEIFNITVIVGPGFDSKYIDKVIKLTKKMSHQITFCKSPSNLAKQMNECDFAISTSGLTKYELAATGTPSIILSIDNYHHIVNKSFSEKGSIINLGVSEDISKLKLAETILAIKDDFIKRQQLSFAGQTLIDGKGTNRLAEKIVNLI